MNKKEFNEEQLILIRDTYGELCYNYIINGKLEYAQESLDIINVIQSQLGDDEYEDITSFALQGNGSWSECQERILDECEENVVDALTKWAKSEKTEPTEDLVNTLEEYLKVFGKTSKEDAIKYRKQTMNSLIIVCVRDCSEKEIEKLYSIVKPIANNIKE